MKLQSKNLEALRLSLIILSKPACFFVFPFVHFRWFYYTATPSFPPYLSCALFFVFPAFAGLFLFGFWFLAKWVRAGLQ